MLTMSLIIKMIKDKKFSLKKVLENEMLVDMLKLSKYPLHLFGTLEYVSNKGIDHREELILFLFVLAKRQKSFLST